MNHQQLIDGYVSGPQMLRAAVADMTAEQFDAAPIPGKWSTRQVVCHLADCEVVYADRMKRAIAEDEPLVFSFDHHRFVERLAYDIRVIEDELRLIESVRVHMARILGTLRPDDFQRKLTHSEDGVMTLETLLERINAHIPHHVKFIEEKKRALA